jgi:hypothetical protein
VLTPACGAVAVAFAANHRSVLEDLFNMNDGANWSRRPAAFSFGGQEGAQAKPAAGWMTDAPLNEWDGVTADEDDNVTQLDLHSYQLTCLSLSE